MKWNLLVNKSAFIWQTINLPNVNMSLTCCYRQLSVQYFFPIPVFFRGILKGFKNLINMIKLFFDLADHDYTVWFTSMNPKYFKRLKQPNFWQRAILCLKNNFLMQFFKEYRNPINCAPFDIFGAKICWLFTPQSAYKISLIYFCTI